MRHNASAKAHIQELFIMPMPAILVQNPVDKGASFTFTDYRGNSISFKLKGQGGDISRGDAETLAGKISVASNACQSRVAIHNEIRWNDADLRFYDEAEASVEKVIVIVLLHDTDSKLNQEVLIPAFDASLLLPDMQTVDITNQKILDVVQEALDIVNDDDNAGNPDNYHGFRAYTTTRKASKTRGNVVRNLPLPTEPGILGEPPDAPA